MQTIKLIVTPQQAADWLEKSNTANRPIRNGWVFELARRIKDGEWKMTHQGIAFDEKGMLLDGQHRLAAIVKSGIAVEMLVTTGFAIQNRATDFPVDCGTIRRANDVWNISPAASQTISFIAKIANSGIRSHASLKPFIAAFMPTCEAMLGVCSSTAKYKSCAAVKAAVCIHGSRSDVDPEQIFRQYRAFVLLDTEIMCPSLISLTKQVGSGKQIGKEANTLFVRAFRAFDPANTQKQTVVISDHSAVWLEAKEMIKGIMEAKQC